MKRQRALHFVVSATIALSIGDCSVIAASSSGGGSSSSSLNSVAAGRRPISSRAKFSPSSTTKTATLGRDGLRSSNDGSGRDNSSSSSSRRRAVDILNLDIDDDDSDQLLRGGYSPGDLGDDDDDAHNSPLRELEDFDYETGEGGMIDNDDDFDMDGLLDLDDGDEGDLFSPSSNGQGKDDDSDNEYGQGSEKGALYDAYNLLHSLAQVRSIFVNDHCFFVGHLEFCSFRIATLTLLILMKHRHLLYPHLHFYTGLSKAI